MVISGRVHNGVIAIGNEVSLPEGMETMVVVSANPVAAGDRMPEEERRWIRDIMDRIAALPDENPGDTISGADHDRVLYGEV
jgi:hypothetical protein